MAQANDDDKQGQEGQANNDQGAGGNDDPNLTSGSQAADGGGGEDGGGGDDVDRPLSEEERDILREHRRQERKDVKGRRREAIARKDRYISQLENQVKDLTGRVETVENRASGADLARLDGAIESAAQEVELAKSARMEARKANAVDIEMEAEEAWYGARRKLEELSLLKRRIADGQRDSAARRSAGTPSAPDPEVVERASKWSTSHTWYNRTGSDEDSDIVRVVDKNLTREGWDPKTQEYWDELDDRLKTRIPHRFRDGGGNGQQRRQTTGGGGGDSPGGRGGGVTLSAERVAALKEANMWDDPKQRARMIKRYQDADRAASDQR